MLLAKLFQQLKKHSDFPFEVEYIVMDPGYNKLNREKIEENATLLNVPIKIFESDIFDVTAKEESSPCYLCARMRRGVLHDAVKELGCNKLALGHHFDDAAETLMLNLFFEGRIGCFQPVTDLSRVGIRVIRPLIYMPERHVKDFARKVELPVIQSPCPADKNTQREEMHNLINELDRKNKGLRYRIYGAIQRGEVDGFKPVGGMTGIKDCSPGEDD